MKNSKQKNQTLLKLNSLPLPTRFLTNLIHLLSLHCKCLLNLRKVIVDLSIHFFDLQNILVEKTTSIITIYIITRYDRILKLMMLKCTILTHCSCNADFFFLFF